MFFPQLPVSRYSTLQNYALDHLELWGLDAASPYMTDVVVKGLNIMAQGWTEYLREKYSDIDFILVSLLTMSRFPPLSLLKISALGGLKYDHIADVGRAYFFGSGYMEVDGFPPVCSDLVRPISIYTLQAYIQLHAGSDQVHCSILGDLLSER